MEYFWKELGQVDAPKKYRLNGVGMVDVTQQDIDDAEQLGGNILMELIDVSTAATRIPEFRIGKFTPVDDDHGKMVF